MPVPPRCGPEQVRKTKPAAASKENRIELRVIKLNTGFVAGAPHRAGVRGTRIRLLRVAFPHGTMPEDVMSSSSSPRRGRPRFHDTARLALPGARVNIEGGAGSRRPASLRNA